MCGLLGEFPSNNSKLTIFNEFEKILNLSIHRGPDATIIENGDFFRLGFNRLAVQDVSERGNQPMTSPSGKFKMVFNGEIYNCQELRSEYGLRNLKSHADSEVIIRLVELIGVEETAKVLDGIFAITIVDCELEKVYLIRDFAGVKPLFFGLNPKGLVCASQFNQVFKHPWFFDQLKLRKETVKEYFGFGFMQAPNTIFHDIFQVRPGTIIIVDQSGNLEENRYLEFSKDFRVDNKFDIDVYKSVIEQCVHNQLVSDVPLATFLSGGIDSPLIAALAKKNQNDINAFTLGVNDQTLDETHQAMVYAKELELTHQIEQMKSEDILNEIDAHFTNMSEPFGDYSSIPTFVITKKAKENYTVMLSGDGGDELFFGYPRMLDVLQKKHWFRYPFYIRKPIIRIFNKLGLMNSWAAYSNRSFEDFVKSKHLHIDKSVLDRVFPNTLFSKEMNELYAISAKNNAIEVLHQLRWNEFYSHLQRVLAKVDRMSMANSVEVRVPFLAKNALLNAWNYKPIINKKYFELKEVLKNMLKTLMPSGNIEQVKKGFNVPMDYWLKNELREEIHQVIFEQSFFGKDCIHVEEIQKYVSDYFNNENSNAWGVWHIYAWQKWALKEGLIE